MLPTRNGNAEPHDAAAGLPAQPAGATAIRRQSSTRNSNSTRLPERATFPATTAIAAEPKGGAAHRDERVENLAGGALQADRPEAHLAHEDAVGDGDEPLEQHRQHQPGQVAVHRGRPQRPPERRPHEGSGARKAQAQGDVHQGGVEELLARGLRVGDDVHADADVGHHVDGEGHDRRVRDLAVGVGRHEVREHQRPHDAERPAQDPHDDEEQAAADDLLADPRDPRRPRRWVKKRSPGTGN